MNSTFTNCFVQFDTDARFIEPDMCNVYDVPKKFHAYIGGVILKLLHNIIQATLIVDKILLLALKYKS